MKRILEYKDTIKILTLSDLKLKYASSTLGFLWSILEPLLLIGVYSLVFPLILNADFYEWVLYFLAGFIPFRYFERGIRSATTSLVDNRNVLNRVDIPYIIIPISVVLSDSISFFLESLLFFGLILLSGISPTRYMIFFPLLFLMEFFFILGIGMYLSISYVKLRDLNYILNVLFQALFFLTPTVYRLGMIPIKYRSIYLSNPIARLVLLYQEIALRNLASFSETIPTITNISILLIFSISTLIVGFCHFIRRNFKIGEKL